jgi:hypothetical protein
LALPIGVQAQENVRRAEPVNPGLSYETSPGGSNGTLMQRTVLVDPNKRLGVGDQVAIEIVEDREGPTSRLITATGDLEVPPLDRVHVAGKTTTEAAAEIKRLLELDYYYTATVKLSIDRVNVAAALGKIQISGEVAAPGVLEFNLADPLTLNEAILKAGNFKDFRRSEESPGCSGKGWCKKRSSSSMSKPSSEMELRTRISSLRTVTGCTSQRYSSVGIRAGLLLQWTLPTPLRPRDRSIPCSA